MVETDSPEEQIKLICQDMAQGKWNKYWSEDCFLIRPSGNPLYPEQELQMRNCQDLTMTKEELVDINKICIYGNLATCCFTVHQVFNYKGTFNDDISVVLIVLKKDEDGWKMITGSRSQGRTPADPLPEFR